jgi:AcrR family transcriptional regulator
MQDEAAGDSEGEGCGVQALGCQAFLSRRERRRKETRERLLEAALRLLSERDFDAVTVEMITEAANVGKGTFFNYFANKEAIVAYLFESRLRLLAEILEEGKRQKAKDKRRKATVALPEQCAARIPVGGPHWRRIVGITHLMGELDGTSKRLQRTLLSLALTNDAVRAASVGKRGRIIAVGGELVRAAQAAGELRDDLSAEALMDYLINIYFNVLYAWSQSDSEESLHVVIERIYALAWEGVRPPEKGQD